MATSTEAVAMALGPPDPPDRVVDDGLLPEGTRDDEPDPADRAAAARSGPGEPESGRDRWLREQRPPHHGD